MIIMVSNSCEIFPQVMCYLKSQLFCFLTKHWGKMYGHFFKKPNKSREEASSPVSHRFSVILSLSKECRWREMEEHRQAERLQRQLQQEQAYLLSLQHDHRRPHPQHSQQPPPPQQERSKPSFHAPEPKVHYEPADRAREVSSFLCHLDVALESSTMTLQNCVIWILERA